MPASVEKRGVRAAVLVGLVAGFGASARAGQPAATGYASWSDQRKEAFLREGAIVRTKSAGSGITHSLRATLRQGDVQHDAHIQVIDQAKPVADLPGGIDIDFRDTYRNNVAAYRLDRLLGLGMIPVSVVRSYEGKAAAYTWWVDGVAMTESDRRRKKLNVPDVAVWNQETYVVRVFDQLICNADRNLGNLLIDQDWRIWMIDHTRAFKTFKHLSNPKVLGNHCARGLLEGLRRLDRATLDPSMEGLLTPEQIQGLLARRQRIVAYYDAQIAALGEKVVLYDLPPRVPSAAAPLPAGP
jgi:hypothetical protein